MKNQLRTKLALRKETIRALDKLALDGIAGGLPTTFTQQASCTLACPTARICLTTATTTNPK